MMHLTRNLYSDDLQDVWENADHEVLECLGKLICPTSPFIDTFPLLATLPCRKGGLGFTSMARVRSGAYKAAQEASDFLIDRIIAAADERAPPLTQKFHTQELWTDVESDLMDKLPEDSKAILEDHRSPASFRWMLMMPGPDEDCTLSDKQVSVGLMIRSLHTGISSVCSCQAVSFPSHDLICSKNAKLRAARHEALKHVLVKAYKTTKCTIRFEPFSKDSTSRSRGDLAIRGLAAQNGFNMVIDISVVAPITVARKRVDIQKVMQFRHDRKIEKYKGLLWDGEFFPFILTSGGTLHNTIAH
jgi:hypothetical protein